MIKGDAFKDNFWIIFGIIILIIMLANYLDQRSLTH